jgi:transcription elongation factor GreB
MLQIQPGKNPFTRAGHDKLVEEFENLQTKERPRVVKGVADAAAEGDRSENAEYIYGKKKLREIDKRLKYLSGLLKNVQIVDVRALRGDQVCFASTATLEDEDGNLKTWTIVGDGEAEPARGSISYKSPVAKAILGKRVGDVATVNRPAGEIDVEIVELRFGDKIIASSQE